MSEQPPRVRRDPLDDRAVGRNAGAQSVLKPELQSTGFPHQVLDGLLRRTACLGVDRGRSFEECSLLSFLLHCGHEVLHRWLVVALGSDLRMADVLDVSNDPLDKPLVFCAFAERFVCSSLSTWTLGREILTTAASTSGSSYRPCTPQDSLL